MYPFKYILPEAAKKKDKSKEKEGKGKGKGEENQEAFRGIQFDHSINQYHSWIYFINHLHNLDIIK